MCRLQTIHCGDLNSQISRQQVRIIPLFPTILSYLPSPSGYANEETIPSDIHVKPDEIGTIAVRVFLAENWRRSGSGSPKKYSIQSHPPALIDEQTKKGGEHCVS